MCLNFQYSRAKVEDQNQVSFAFKDLLFLGACINKNKSDKSYVIQRRMYIKSTQYHGINFEKNRF